MKKALALLLAICITACLLCTGCGEKAGKDQAFVHWLPEAAPVSALKEYVAAVTREGSEDYIPPEDRIAVFDLDGTLYCETFPIYAEWLLFSDYVLNTPGLPAELTAVARELSAFTGPADIPAHMEQTHIHAHAAAFAGMPIADYMDVVKAFQNTAAEGFRGMTRGEAFYLPMLEIVDYLQENGFLVYICSGTNRFTVRALIDGVIDIPPRQVIGSDFTIVASGQGEEADMHYSYTAGDILLMGDTVITKNVKMSKVAQLEQELGQKPVLLFANSTGDIPMAVYAQTDNPYPTEVFFLLCDDLEREHGNLTRARQIADICRENAWHTISMAEDWRTVYGEAVTAEPQ